MFSLGDSIDDGCGTESTLDYLGRDFDLASLSRLVSSRLVCIRLQNGDSDSISHAVPSQLFTILLLSSRNHPRQRLSCSLAFPLFSYHQTSQTTSSHSLPRATSCTSSAHSSSSSSHFGLARRRVPPSTRLGLARLATFLRSSTCTSSSSSSSALISAPTPSSTSSPPFHHNSRQQRRVSLPPYQISSSLPPSPPTRRSRRLRRIPQCRGIAPFAGYRLGGRGRHSTRSRRRGGGSRV